jgi:hypothetical protein
VHKTVACGSQSTAVGNPLGHTSGERWPEGWSFERQFEFLMVKLLRVYGECLGTRSR